MMWSWEDVFVPEESVTARPARTWDTYNGARSLGIAEYPHATDEQTLEKFNRACAYAKVDAAQRERARAAWGNLREVRDIGDAIQTLAKFGQPRPLSA